MHIRVFCLVLLTIVAGATPVSATLVQLNPSKDNTLIQQTDSTKQLSNGQGDIFVGRTAQDGSGPNTTATISIRRGLVAFDLSSIPTNATITNVSLQMRDVMGLNGDPLVELHRVQQDWGEGASFQNGGMGATAQNGDATWLYSFFNTNVALRTKWESGGSDTPGGNFNPSVSGSTVVSDDNGGLQLFTWSSSDLLHNNLQMITDVQNWVSNPSSNFGWLLKGDESQGQTAKRLNSGDPPQPGMQAGVSPVLSVTYSVVVPEPSALVLLGIGLGMVGLKINRRRRSA